MTDADGVRDDDEVRDAAAAFAETAGRRPRILIAGGTPGGLIGSLSDLGFDVDVAAEVTGPDGAAAISRQALDADVHLVAVRPELVTAVRAALDAHEGAGIGVVIHRQGGAGGSDISSATTVLDDAGATPADVLTLLLSITQQR